MNTNKFLVGGIIGGVANFLLGWLVWGMLLMNFMKENMGTATGVMKAEDEMIWWALVVGNFFFGFLLSYVLNKTGVTEASSGATTGAILGLLLAGGFDFIMYGTANLMMLNAVLVDIVANVVVSAVVGGIIGWYLGMGKKAA